MEAEVVGPEAGRSGRGDEEGDDENEPDGLQSNHSHGGYESHEEDVESEGGPALGGGKVGIEAKEGEFFQQKKASDGGDYKDDDDKNEVAHDHGGGFSVDEGFKSG